jgi:hypothetical protein
MLEYKVIRSARRKTLGLQVKQGKVIVRAPDFLTDKQIHSFINEKSAWVKAKVDFQKLQPELLPPSFIQGCSLLIHGERKNLTIAYQSRAQILNLSNEFCVILPIRNRMVNDQLSSIEISQEKVKKQLEKWFKEQATSYLSTRLAELSEQTQLLPKSFKIRQYKARWGSCNNRGELSFNYLLMMAPFWVVDYVIVHELCHLRHLNHSKEFWRLVAQHSPNFQQAQDWLKNHQRQLTWH